MLLTTQVQRCLLFLSATPFLLFAFACGGKGNDGKGDGGSKITPVPYEDFVQTWADTICSRAFACCTQDELTDGLAGYAPSAPASSYASEQACAADFANQYRAEYSWILDLVTLGDLAYDGEAAARCFQAMADASCTVFAAEDIEDLPECDSVLTPTRGLGETCNDPDIGCIGGWATSYCDFPSGAESGVCRALPKAGEACADGWLCDGSSTCDDNTNKCVAVTVAAQGAACDDNTTVCESGLVCVPGSGQGTTCQAPLPEGASCSADLQCLSWSCNATTSTCDPLVCDGK